MWSIGTDAARSVVCMFVCWSHGRTVHKQLNHPDTQTTLRAASHPDVVWGWLMNGKGHFWGGCAGALQRTYTRMHCARRWPICLPSARNRRMHSTLQGVTRRDAASCQILLWLLCFVTRKKLYWNSNNTIAVLQFSSPQIGSPTFCGH